MQKNSTILSIDETSFRANLYTSNHFRMIGVIDAFIAFKWGNEKVTLAFYSSSGTNTGKIKGYWYPIAGIKLVTGPFVEFTPIINQVLKNTCRFGDAHSGWLAKSLFFPPHPLPKPMINGYGEGPYYNDLIALGKTLKKLYESGKFISSPHLNPVVLNNLLLSDKIYDGNKHTQQENFESFIYEVYSLSFPTPINKKVD